MGPGYDTKQSDGEIPVVLEPRGMQNTPSMPSLPVPLWPGVVAIDKVLSMGQIELNCVIKRQQISSSYMDSSLHSGNSVVWMVSSCSLISKSSCLFIIPLGIVPSAPITIGVTVSFMFHSPFFFF